MQLIPSLTVVYVNLKCTSFYFSSVECCRKMKSVCSFIVYVNKNHEYCISYKKTVSLSCRHTLMIKRINIKSTMKLLKGILYGALFVAPFTLYAQRSNLLLNDNWQFRFSHQVQPGSAQRVDLPHTWNAQDALAGKVDYKRGLGNYEKKLFVDEKWKGKRLFIRFEGANTVTHLFVNGKCVGEHRGGYGAFVFEITHAVTYGQENSILARVNNAEQLDIMPLVGDFNMYGGIYRDVHLLVTEDVCISPLDYASSGVRLVQDSVSSAYARVNAKIQLSSSSEEDRKVELRLRLKDDKGTVIQEKCKVVALSAKENIGEEIPVEVVKPHLWNGREDPYLYRVEVALLENGKVLDEVVQPLGLRYYRIDPERGFFLNGRHLQLKGVCRHQDRSEVGNALRKEHHDEDVALMLEMGVNAVRLAHYPQSSYFYDLMDKYGIIVWAEIPFVGPGGYADKGFVDTESFRHNGKEQLRELIRQHYNHPSICVWGLFNELKTAGDNPVAYIKELNELAHQEDPTRWTTSASNQSGEINYITDAIAWNRYDGWYGGDPGTLGVWLDDMHRQKPELCIGISEYGAGASVYHQQDSLLQPVPSGWWHPENWQTYYHRANWQIISSRPFVWGSFVWNMFDFGAAHRTEGDRPGINDKGLVTYDCKVKKDAFYFYKANWNQDVPVLYLAGKRNRMRSKEIQSFMVFTNYPEAELFVNGKSCGKAKADALATVIWNDVQLQKGENKIEVVAGTGKNRCTDSFTCIYEGN